MVPGMFSNGDIWIISHYYYYYYRILEVANDPTLVIVVVVVVSQHTVTSSSHDLYILWICRFRWGKGGHDMEERRSGGGWLRVVVPQIPLYWFLWPLVWTLPSSCCSWRDGKRWDMTWRSRSPHAKVAVVMMMVMVLAGVGDCVLSVSPYRCFPCRLLIEELAGAIQVVVCLCVWWVE